jgi:hypothetical protein
MELNIGKKEGMNGLKASLNGISLEVLNNLNHTNELIEVKEFNNKLDGNQTIEVCREIADKHNVPIFCVVNNFNGMFNPVTNPLDTPFELALCNITRNKHIYFFYEDSSRSLVSKSKYCQVSEVRAEINTPDNQKIYAECFFVIKDKSQFDQLKKDIEIGKLYGFEGMHIVGEGTKKGVRGQYAVKEHYIIITRYWIIEEDRSFLNKVVPLIKGPNDLAVLWDFEKDKNPWTDVETIIYLLSLFYMEHNQSTYNLIIFGEPSSKKTGLLQALSAIFQTDLLMGTGIRGKVLVPTWGGKEFHRGLLLESKYVILIDEWFRSFGEEERYLQAKKSIKAGLQRIMNALDRTHQKGGTGIGTYSYAITNSFISTDNFGYEKELKDLNKEDPAILKRYTVMKLSEGSVERGKDLFPLSIDEIRVKLKAKLAKVGLNFSKFRVLSNYMREQMQKDLSVDFDRVRKIAKETVKTYTQIYGKVNYEYDIKLRSMIKSIVVLNALFRAKKHLPNRYVTIDDDYDMFQCVFERLTEDHFKVYGTPLAKDFETNEIPGHPGQLSLNLNKGGKK